MPQPRPKPKRTVASRLLLLAWSSTCWPAVAKGEARAAEPLAVEYRAPSGESLPLYKRSLAVVIGIDQYDHLPTLGGAVRDAKQVADFLRGSGFGVTLLTDKAATRQAVTQLLGDDLPAKMNADDRVVIYFAGHGLSRGSDEAAMGYLMPVEARREQPASTAISMAELQRWFGTYPARHVLYLADACYSGLAIGTRAAGLPTTMKDYLREVTRRPLRAALVAGTAGQEAHEYQGHGLFTGFVLAGVKGAADANKDGLVTTDELAAYVKPNVAQIAAAQFGKPQHPQMGRSGEGEFLFVVPRLQTAPVVPTGPSEPAPRLGMGRPLAPVEGTPQPIGVLDFAIEGPPALGVLSKPLAEQLTLDLARDEALALAPRAAVARAVRQAQAASAIGAPALHDVAQRCGVHSLLVGRVREAGEQIAIEVEWMTADGQRLSPVVRDTGPVEAAALLVANAAARLRTHLNLRTLDKPSASWTTREQWRSEAQTLDSADAADSAGDLDAPLDASPTGARLSVRCAEPGSTVHWAGGVRPAPATLATPAGEVNVVCKASGYRDAPRSVRLQRGEQRLLLVNQAPLATTLRRDLDTGMQLRVGGGYFLLPATSLAVGSDNSSYVQVRYPAKPSSGSGVQTRGTQVDVFDVQSAANPVGLLLDWSVSVRGHGIAFAFDWMQADIALVNAKVRDSDYEYLAKSDNLALADLAYGRPARLTRISAWDFSCDYVYRKALRRLQIEARTGIGIARRSRTAEFTLSNIDNAVELNNYSLFVPARIGASLFVTERIALFAHYQFALVGDGRRGVVAGIGWAP